MQVVCAGRILPQRAAAPASAPAHAELVEGLDVMEQWF
jgi:hypothetical protein